MNRFKSIIGWLTTAIVVLYMVYKGIDITAIVTAAAAILGIWHIPGGGNRE